MIACFRFGSDTLITCAMISFILLMLTLMWYDKWREKHPHNPAELTVRDAEIIRMKPLRRYPFQKKERQRVLIYAGYPEPDGRQRRARLATAPLRQTLAEQAPELKDGAKIRISYEKKRRASFILQSPCIRSRRFPASRIPFLVWRNVSASRWPVRSVSDALCSVFCTADDGSIHDQKI